MQFFLALALLGTACSKDNVITEVNSPWRRHRTIGLMYHPEDNALDIDRWELGRRMFFDPQFSIDGSVSCASCHILQMRLGR